MYPMQTSTLTVNTGQDGISHLFKIRHHNNNLNMKTVSRRTFINKSTMGISAALALSQLPKQLLSQALSPSHDISIGFQTFPIRDKLAKDFAGILKIME